jgi:PhnB protein
MHAAFRIGQTLVMDSDGQCGSRPTLQGFSLSLPMPRAAAAEVVFARLAEGGHAQMPSRRLSGHPCFGTLRDRFGVTWMVTVEGSGS